MEFIGQKIEFPVTLSIGRGLENAITNNTLVGHIDGKNGKLYYRGFSIEDLAKHSTFEEVCYLLIYGKLPVKKELDEFSRKLKQYRVVPADVIGLLEQFPEKMTSMHMLASSVAILAGYDDHAHDLTLESETEIAIKIISQIATLTGAITRIKEKEPVIEPDLSLSHAANFLYMMTGEKMNNDSFGAKAMDTALVIHADHGMNPSTFAAMVIHSSLSCLYSTIAGAIGSLKGPLHGGANERAVEAMLEIRSMGGVDKVEEWYRNKRANNEKIFGFGHRVYKAYDPRARLLHQYVSGYCLDDDNVIGLCEINERLEKAVIADLGETKGIFPNVDLYSGLLFMYMGIKPYMYTPIFAVGRVAGWTARTLEFMTDNRIFRPRANYYGPINEKYIPIEDRK